MLPDIAATMIDYDVDVDVYKESRYFADVETIGEHTINLVLLLTSACRFRPSSEKLTLVAKSSAAWRRGRSTECFVVVWDCWASPVFFIGPQSNLENKSVEYY